MATKHTRRGWKLDQAKISSKPYELKYVQAIFYKEDASYSETSFFPLMHPPLSKIKELVKEKHNSRQNVYAALKAEGWKRIMKPKAK